MNFRQRVNSSNIKSKNLLSWPKNIIQKNINSKNFEEIKYQTSNNKAILLQKKFKN